MNTGKVQIAPPSSGTTACYFMVSKNVVMNEGGICAIYGDRQASRGSNRERSQLHTLVRLLAA